MNITENSDAGHCHFSNSTCDFEGPKTRHLTDSTWNKSVRHPFTEGQKAHPNHPIFIYSNVTDDYLSPFEKKSREMTRSQRQLSSKPRCGLQKTTRFCITFVLRSGNHAPRSNMSNSERSRASQPRSTLKSVQPPVND